MADTSSLLKYGLGAILVLVGLWLVVQIVSFILGLIWTGVQLAIGLLVILALLYGIYWLYQTFVASSSSSRSSSREREKIYER